MPTIDVENCRIVLQTSGINKGGAVRSPSLERGQGCVIQQKHIPAITLTNAPPLKRGID